MYESVDFGKCTPMHYMYDKYLGRGSRQHQGIFHRGVATSYHYHWLVSEQVPERF